MRGVAIGTVDARHQYMNSPVTDFLCEVQKRAHVFIQPVNPEMLDCFLAGLVKGILLENPSVNDTAYRRSRETAMVSKGWTYSAAPPFLEMRNKGLSDEEIVREQMAIEIETWRLLEH